jgi:hypothetical protein
MSIGPMDRVRGKKMKNLVRFGHMGAWLLLLALWPGASAQAQYQQGYGNAAQRPPFSPYLNLLRTGSSPAINYYGIVRPEVAFSNSIYQLQGQQTQLSNQQDNLAAYTALPTTGHASGFMTQGKYFMSSGGGQSQVGGQGQPGSSAPAAKGR